VVPFASKLLVAIQTGDILAGYRVTRLLGRGAMGEVWAAVNDARSDRDARVAIKVLLPRAASNRDFVRRFEREAEIASSIDSPFVCRLIEVGSTADGSDVLVFEHLDGVSLADRLDREHDLPLGEVGSIVDDVLQGLVAAHAAGVIHRDLKPANIFLVTPDAPRGGSLRREHAKILDFGVSKRRGAEAEQGDVLTGRDEMLGSLAYMAPEQIRSSADADERADLYAVGAVAFRALAGRLPFEGRSTAQLVAMKIDRAAPSLAQATGERWPARLERFLERALAKNRDARFATAAEALAEWRAAQPSAIGTAQDGLPARAPMPSYPIVEDMPTEVDDPPGSPAEDDLPSF
jgi:serine/threonine-protein kinase